MAPVGVFKLQTVTEDARTDEELLTAAELSRRTGASATTFMNWTRYTPALPTVTIRDGTVRFTPRHVLAFCAANPHLRATARVQRALRQSSEPAHQTPATAETRFEVNALKSLARDLRNAAHQNLQVALTGARLAEETARSHREQLDQLAASMASYDAALTQLTAPSTLND